MFYQWAGLNSTIANCYGSTRTQIQHKYSTKQHKHTKTKTEHKVKKKQNITYNNKTYLHEVWARKGCLGWRGGSGTALLVGRSRDRSPLVSVGIFFEATNGTICPWVDSASKNEYQENSWGWRRPVRKGDDLRTFIVPKVEKIRSLNLLESQGPAQACSRKTLPLSF
jgi:hypothetical protein